MKQLKRATYFGDFTTKLQYNAHVSNVSGLTAATSSQITHLNATVFSSDTDSSKTVSLGLIVGVAVGGFFALLALIVLACNCLSKNDDEEVLNRIKLDEAGVSTREIRNLVWTN